MTEGSSTRPASILVLGASGKTGNRVLERLRLLGFNARGASRSTPVRFDWEDQATWEAALAGADRAYVTFQPDVAVPGACETLDAFFRLAVKSGVKRLVFLSGRGEPEAEEAERALRASGADWTILRCSWFSQNFSEGIFLEPILAGELALPVGAVGEPFLDAEDIADVAVAALTEPGHSHMLYEMTGPRAITFAEAVRKIAAVTDRKIDFKSISNEQFRRGMLDAHVPLPVVDMVQYLFTTVLDGRNERPADGVQRALGRPARSFDEYVHRCATSGVWARS